MAGPFEVTPEPYIIAAGSLDSLPDQHIRALGINGLFLIVVVIAIGVLFAIIMVAGHGGRKSL